MNPYSIPPVVVSLAILAIGIFVFTRNAKSPIHRAWFSTCLSHFLWLFAYGILFSQQSIERAELIAKIGYSGVTFIPVTFYHFTLYFSNKEASLRNSLPVFYLISLGFTVSIWFSPYFVSGVSRFFWGFYPRAGFLHPVYLTYFIGLCSTAVIILYLSVFRQERVLSREESRRGLLIFIAYAVDVFACVDFLPNYGIEIYPLGYFFSGTFILLAAYAIFVFKLMDVGIFVKKTLSYSVLAALITALYLVMVLIMEKWFQGFFGYRSIFATLFVAFLISISFNPLRSRIQAFVDRAIFKATPEELVAQRDKLLQEVRKSEQMKAVGTLAAGLAHEIKNPLASIKTFTDYLKERYDDPVFRAKFQKIVGGEVERINLIVQQLLDFAKPVPPKLAPVEIAGLLDETVELLSGEFVQRHIQVTRSYVERAFVLGDPQQLKQLFLNLFLNSLDAINGSGTLDVRTRIEAAELVIGITDNGCGIAPKDLPYIFDPFFTTKETGTGLGLPVVQGILSEHRGRIEVASRPGQGTTFTIRLPLAA